LSRKTRSGQLVKKSCKIYLGYLWKMRSGKKTIQGRKLEIIKGILEIEDVESIEFLEAFLRNKIRRISKEDLLEGGPPVEKDQA
jgi:hypothetical protein